MTQQPQQLPAVGQASQARAQPQLTDQQAKLVEGLLSGMPSEQAWQEAGYSSELGYRNALRSVAVQAALLEARRAQLSGDLAQEAMQAIRELVTDRTTPAATRLAASKWVLEQAGHGKHEQDERDVPLHEMTAEQLDRFMAKAQAVIDRGGERPIIAVTPGNGA